MNKTICLLFFTMLILSISASCKKEKESPMVDMDTIKADGSRDNKYIFRKEIEKEESRKNKYKKNEF